MPVLLDGAVEIPTQYEPFYIYTVPLVASPSTAITLGDLLFPDSSGNFDRLVTDDAVLTTGYCIAAEDFVTGMTAIQVLAPGSVFPFIAFGTDLLPFCLVKFNYASSVQTAVIATATDLAAGKAIGRYRCQLDNTIPVSAANDIIIIHSGCL